MLSELYRIYPIYNMHIYLKSKLSSSYTFCSAIYLFHLITYLSTLVHVNLPCYPLIAEEHFISIDVPRFITYMYMHMYTYVYIFVDLCKYL